MKIRSILCLSAFALLANSASAQNRLINRLDFSRLAPIATQQFHEAEPGQVWNSSNYEGLLTAIRGLENHGLNPEHYHLSSLIQNRDNKEARERLATDAWLSAAAHMVYGKLSPTSVEPDWTAASRSEDLTGKLSDALSSGNLAESLGALAPKQPGYAALITEYESLRELADAGTNIIPAGETLKPGMSGARVTTLQLRLVELGLLSGQEDPSGKMDNLTLEAVKTFQRNADLDDDGVVGAATLSALNRGVQEKLNTLRVNLERWRWLPEELGRRHLRANIAGFNVTTYEDGQPVRTHLTIVGKPYRKTPVFSDEVEYAVFNPWWETPYSLATKDKVPLFRKDPDAVKRLGFQVLDKDGMAVNSSSIDWNSVGPGNFPYRLRQAPGEQNALGQVKIIFPNKHNVYLHDTPTRGLFSQRQRAFSSGCMRTQDPLALSAWLLEDTPGWTKERIETVVKSGKETRVDLKVRVPVHVLYFTAVNEGLGGVRYLDDIYSRDAAVLAGLRTAPEKDKL